MSRIKMDIEIEEKNALDLEQFREEKNIPSIDAAINSILTFFFNTTPEELVKLTKPDRNREIILIQAKVNREEIIKILENSTRPLETKEISEMTGLSVNTVFATINSIHTRIRKVLWVKLPNENNRMVKKYYFKTEKKKKSKDKVVPVDEVKNEEYDKPIIGVVEFISIPNQEITVKLNQDEVDEDLNELRKITYVEIGRRLTQAQYIGSTNGHATFKIKNIQNVLPNDKVFLVVETKNLEGYKPTAIAKHGIQ